MKTLILKNKKEVAEKVSEMIAREIRNNPKINLGLPTGETIIPIYQCLSFLINKTKIDASKIKTFNLDEYISMPPSDKNSYHHFMHEHLFSKINIKKENTNFPEDKKPSLYDKLIKKSGGLDLTILGIGVNGHIAFNEPGSSIKSKTRIVKLTQSTINSNSRFFKDDKVPKKAITIGIFAILSSKKIILVATGKNKAEIIAKTLKSKPSPKIPASFLKRHKKTLVILDENAAYLLNNKL